MSNSDESLVIAISQLLKDTKTSIATAESCTGGLLAKLLTDVSGSSAYFSYGWVTYSNAAKSSELGVDPKLIDRNGAVSEPVACAMAEGARKNAGAELGVGITGIAGPDGGTETKPVGTVCIALASKNSSTRVQTFRFKGDRQSIRNQSALTAMEMIRDHLTPE